MSYRKELSELNRSDLMRIGIIGLGLIAGLLACLLAVSVMPVMATSPQVVAIASGYDSSIALLDNGSVWTWGYNDGGRLGDGTNKNRYNPVQVDISDVKAIAVSNTFMLALKNDGTVWGWGVDLGGSLGKGYLTKIWTPMQINGIDNVVKIATGASGQCFAIKNDGTVWAWGTNEFGELGLGNTTDERASIMPTQVNISNVKDITCCYGVTFILKNDGTVWASGDGEYGLMGNGGYNGSTTFIQVPITNVISIGSGYAHVLAVKDDGTIWAWGNNNDYEVGSFSNSYSQPRPIKVEGIDHVVAVSGGYQHSLALKNDGTVWVWGLNTNGIYGMGIGVGLNSAYPVQVNGMDHVRSISSGDMQNFAIKEDGTLWGWGDNSLGAVGVGDLVYDSTSVFYQKMLIPTQVLFDQPNRVYNTTYQPPALPTPVPTITPSSAGITNFTVQEKWSISNNQSINSIAVGDDGTLYEFSNNTIYCFDSNGKPKWNLTIPDEWSISNELYRTAGEVGQKLPPEPIYDIHNGFLYVYAPPRLAYPSGTYDYRTGKNVEFSSLNWSLLAISPEGKIVWDAPLKTDLMASDGTAIKAAGDRIYVFHCYNETVFDTNGNELFTISNVADPAAVDERGYIYTTRAESWEWVPNQSPIGYGVYFDTSGGLYPDYRIPSTVVEAYSPNGSLYWSRDLGQRIFSQYVVEEIRSKYGTLPLYQNGTLYVNFYRSMTALDINGNIKWEKSFDNGSYILFRLMPIDSRGNLYLENMPIMGSNTIGNPQTNLYVISPDGKEACPPRNITIGYSIDNREAALDGVFYEIDPAGITYSPIVTPKPLGNNSLYDMPTAIITAYDIINDTLLWQYQLPVDQKYETIVNEGNSREILGSGYVYGSLRLLDYRNEGIKDVYALTDVWVYPANGILYINFRSTNVEEPVVLDKSRCVYTGGIIALDNKGLPIFEKTTNNFGTLLAYNNGTIYFMDGGGKISAVAVGIAASGIALLAAALVLFKFIGIGSVTRARSRIDKNKNRNIVTDFVAQNPGVTMYDISKALGMNLGTVRYHLLILGLNHRVATFKDDNKYIRYFPNSKRYSKEEQLLISMMRRDTIKRVIQLMYIKPGLTNAEISSVTGLIDSGVSRYLKELCDKGIVLRSEVTPGRYAYSLKEEATRTVEKIYWVVNGEGKAQPSVPGNAEA